MHRNTLHCDKPFSPLPLLPTVRRVLYIVSSLSTVFFNGGCFLSTLRRFLNLVGSTAIWSPTALSSRAFLCATDRPTMLTSSTCFFDIALLEKRSQARSSGSSISLMRSAEHFWKVSDSSLRVATLFNLELVGLDESGAGEYKKAPVKQLMTLSWQQSWLVDHSTVAYLLSKS